MPEPSRSVLEAFEGVGGGGCGRWRSSFRLRKSHQIREGRATATGLADPSSERAVTIVEAEHPWALSLGWALVVVGTVLQTLPEIAAALAALR